MVIAVRCSGCERNAKALWIAVLVLGAGSTGRGGRSGSCQDRQQQQQQPQPVLLPAGLACTLHCWSWSCNSCQGPSALCACTGTICGLSSTGNYKPARRFVKTAIRHFLRCSNACILPKYSVLCAVLGFWTAKETSLMLCSKMLMMCICMFGCS